MTAAEADNAGMAPILACTVSRDLSEFALLVEDMETELGEAWGDLGFDDALAYLKQPEAKDLTFIAIAIDGADEDYVPRISEIITQAKKTYIPVILIADNVGPLVLHKLLRLGADDFVPYPLSEGLLHDAITRLKPKAEEQAKTPINPQGLALPEYGPSGYGPTGYGGPTAYGYAAPVQRDAAVLCVHGMAGGVGSTTFAVNLAWELANPALRSKDGNSAPRVCLIDLDLQFGSIATYLDLQRRELVFELLSDTKGMDADILCQALLTFNDRLHVLTAPADMLPLDFIASEDVNRIIELARSQFDFIVVDMPKTVVGWTEAALNQSHIYFAMIEMEMRAAQNTQRMIRALQSESLPVEKLRYMLNRAPKFTDLTGRSRVKRLAESLGISIEVMLPDGGHAVTVANDQALPLAHTIPRSPLRKEIQKIAESLSERERSRATNRAR